MLVWKFRNSLVRAIWRSYGITHILLHIFLSSHHGALSNLESHLGGGIIHEAAKRRMRISPSTTTRTSALLLRITITVLRL